MAEEDKEKATLKTYLFLLLQNKLIKNIPISKGVSVVKAITQKLKLGKCAAFQREAKYLDVVICKTGINSNLDRDKFMKDIL